MNSLSAAGWNGASAVWVLLLKLPVARKFGINVMALLYWEQRAGNWGAVGNSESDIAIEEVDPYDSHLLYEIFLGVDEKYRDARQTPCVFFREMIRSMWPELLEWPINPPDSIRDWCVLALHKLGIEKSLRMLKYKLYEFCYHSWWKGQKNDH